MILALFIILLLGLSWIISAILISFSKSSMKTKNQWLIYLGSILMIIGAIGFFGSALSAIGGLNWLPKSFEWPIGYAKNIIRMNNGNIVVPHTASGRIQIYSKELRYIRGWHVDASGGIFKARELDDHLEVLTARGNRRILYDVFGNIITSDHYSYDYNSAFPETAISINIPTFPLFIGFTDPFIAWFFAIIGILILGIREKGIKFLFKRS